MHNRRILFVLLLLILAPIAAAQSTPQAYWHISDAYTIQFDGAGNAFVSANLALQSINGGSVNNITLEIPYKNVTIYEVVGSGSRCPGCTNYYNTNYYVASFLNYSVNRTANYTMLNIVLNRSNGLYYDLNDPVLANGSTVNLYIFYSVRNLAHRELRGYAFSFKTMMDNNALIREAYANVAVPENMHLAGRPAFNVTYNAQNAVSGLISGASSAAQTTIVQTYVNQLSSYNYYPSSYSYDYHASNLLAGEFFTITGIYGSSLLLLYLPSIIIGVIAAIIMIVLFYYLLLPRLKKLFYAPAKQKTASASQTGFSYMRPMVYGIISGFLFQLVFYSFKIVISAAVNGGYYYGEIEMAILLLLLGIIFSSLALFGLPYRLYARFSKKEGFLAALISIIAAIVFALLILLVIHLLSPPLVSLQTFSKI